MGHWFLCVITVSSNPMTLEAAGKQRGDDDCIFVWTGEGHSVKRSKQNTERTINNVKM